MLGVMVGLDPKAQDSRHHGRYGSEVQLCRCLVSLLVTLQLALFFLPCRQAQDSRHHGRYGSEVQYVGAWLFCLCRKS